MKNLVISRHSLGVAIARALAIVFGITAIRTLAIVLAYVFRVTRGNGSIDLLSPDYFLPEAVEFFGSGGFAIWLWGRAETFLPAINEDEADEEQVAISPGLVTQGVLLALALYLFIPSATRLIDACLTMPSAFRFVGQLDNFVDVFFSLVLFIFSFAAYRGALRSVERATSANTDLHQPQPEHAAVQIPEDFGPPAR